MKTTVLALSAGLFTAGLAMAAGETFTSADANGDGALTMAEVIVVMPTTTAEDFAAADADGNGALTEAEFGAAIESGVLRTSG